MNHVFIHCETIDYDFFISTTNVLSNAISFTASIIITIFLYPLKLVKTATLILYNSYEIKI